MNIKYKVYKDDDNIENFNTNISYCCDEMKEHFEESSIKFGEYDPSTVLKDFNVNIRAHDSFTDGIEMAIKFCPFCGELIVIENMD